MEAMESQYEEMYMLFTIIIINKVLNVNNYEVDKMEIRY